MFGVVSILISVANAISAATEDVGDVHDRRDFNSDDSDDGIGCRPLVDILEEEDELVVLIEIPGCYSEEFEFKVREDVLILVDEDDREYHEILLPEGYNLDDPTSTLFNNGVITLRYQKVYSLVC